MESVDACAFHAERTGQNKRLAGDSPPPGDTMELMGQVVRIINRVLPGGSGG